MANEDDDALAENVVAKVILDLVKRANVDEIKDFFESKNVGLEHFKKTVDSNGNSCVHWCVLCKRPDVLSVVLDHCSRDSNFEDRRTFIALKNHKGKTALDLATENGNRKMSWALLRYGRSSAAFSEINLLKSVPDFDGGNSFLHIFARSNYADQIKEFVEESDRATFMASTMKPNSDGDTPAMTAARRGNKEALLALILPLLTSFSDDLEQLSRFLHHQNKDGQQLLAFVSYQPENLSVIHGILMELETKVHQHDSYAVKECLRNSLGSNMSAMFSKDLFQRLGQRRPNGFAKVVTFFKIALITFILKTLFLVLDMYTDIMLIKVYYDQWISDSKDDSTQVFFPGLIQKPSDPCKETLIKTDNDTTVAYHVWKVTNTTLSCYPGAIHGRERFIITLTIVLLPFTLYFFELLRFRTFNKWLEANLERASKTSELLGRFVVKPMVNLVLWWTWPLRAYAGNMWFKFKSETSTEENQIWRYIVKAQKSSLISTRAQLIEVCTEASLQPLFQFYLVFQEIVKFVVREDEARTKVIQLDAFVNFIYDSHRRQMISVVISIFTLAFSYTMHYRQKKDGALPAIQTIFYFISVLCLIISRILCFQMFAYYLGPGAFGNAMLAVLVHAILMTLLHFTFSDSLAQCRKFFSTMTNRQLIIQILLVVHNCFLNGLANIYVHNDINVFVRTKKQAGTDGSPSKRHLTFVPSAFRQKTLMRQLLFDGIILAENIAMMYLAQFTVTETTEFADIYASVVFIASLTYTIGIVFKIIFYLWCHPWSELIRPRDLCDLSTSCVVLSCHVDVNVTRGRPNLSRNRKLDIQRHTSLNLMMSDAAGNVKRIPNVLPKPKRNDVFYEL